MDKILLYFTTIFLLLVMFSKVYKQKYLIVNSISFWFVFFYFCYINFSCLFIDAININWNFSSTTLFLTRCIVSFFNFVFAYLYLFLGKKIEFYDSNGNGGLFKRKQICYKFGEIIIFFGFIILFYCVCNVFLYKQGKSFYAYMDVRNYSSNLQESLHIRFILYFLVSSSFYLFFQKRKIYVFFPLLFVFVLDFLSGTRTLSFIVLIYFYIVYALSKRKLALKIIVPLLLILLTATMGTRNKFLNGDDEAKMGLNIIFGEFFETFTTIPYIVEHSLAGKGFLLERILTDFTFGSFIPGFIRGLISSGYDEVGSEIAHIINKGYGLGSNFITESLYEFGIFGMLMPIGYFIVYLFLDYLLRKPTALVIKIIIAFQTRLFVRQGIASLTVSAYIFCVYFAFFYFQKKNQRQYFFKLRI